ncbi:MAG: DEAD/DEAH box helicase family protein [Verrucomicrobiales bacterium]|nr:DEAD/DEAH box helicase family protein [Verrucomicrobiales bacterium]
MSHPKPSFVEEMNFSKPWRPYQARVLEKLPDFLNDRNLHLVSAPGSGKTVIGLEVLRQIGAPTLVFAPTIAIREQWIDRMKRDFLDGEEPDWLSRDITDPRDVTISTYQSLSSEFRKQGGMDSIIEVLRKKKIATLVVDEAHHLRAMWWKCLSLVKSALPEAMVVALTATPPIDVPAAEWSRYASFCGMVDMEVGVPELVAEGNLCPHQDFVLFSVPTGEDVEELQRFYEGVARFVLDLQLDIDLAEDLGVNSPIQWIDEDYDHEFLKTHQTFFLSLAIFLHQTGGYIPPRIREIFKLDGQELPGELDIEWAEVLLQGLLYQFRDLIESTAGIAPGLPRKLAAMEAQLKDLGAIEKRVVVLRGNEENEKLLRDSTSKLESVAKIVDHELSVQGVLMRAVILTDYIRKKAFPSPGEVDPPLVKLGVVPIFELLRRLRIELLYPAALTGSLVVIPGLVERRFEEIALAVGIDSDNLVMKPLLHDPAFLQVEVRDSDRQRVVAAMTELFEMGEINCLIGTAALLGEGWDAPSINTLILASVIGSFVMSNQMRGRAIRSNPKVPGKTANIWHVATIPPEFELEDQKVGFDAGRDFAKLQRRFEAFHGVGFEIDHKNETLVENGWQRLGLGDSISSAEINPHNQRMFRESEKRENIDFVWKRAIDPVSDGRFLRPVRELRTPRKLAASRFTLKVGGDRDRGIRHSVAGWMEQRRLRKIVKAIYLSLRDLNLISSDYQSWKVRVDVTPKRCLVSLPGLSSVEQVSVITSLDEFFDIFSNPRYLIQQGERFYAVPKRLGEREGRAHDFSKRLRFSGFGRHELIYTQSKEGKLKLLEARKRRMLNHFEFETDTRISWKPEDDEMVV